MIVGADLFYDNREDFDDILATIDFLMTHGQQTCSFLVGYAGLSLLLVLVAYLRRNETVTPGQCFDPCCPVRYQERGVSLEQMQMALAMWGFSAIDLVGNEEMCSLLPITEVDSRFFSTHILKISRDVVHTDTSRLLGATGQ